MRAIPKDQIRFQVTVAGSTPGEVEIRVRPDRFGGWEAIALLHDRGACPMPLGRIFRSRDRAVTVGKMVAWVRRRYQGARPLAGRRSATAPGAPGSGV